MFPLKDNIPTERFPLVTYALIAANVIVYFFFQKHVGHGLAYLNDVSNQNVTKWGAIPYEFTHPGDGCVLLEARQAIGCGPHMGTDPPFWATAFSGMFMHGGLFHLGGNMLFLWIFGNNVEDAMGRVKFVVFYLLGGLCALGLQIAVGPNSAVPTLGASGAIAGVLGGYILLYPRARVLTFIFIVVFFTFVEIPAFLVLGIWIGEQALFGYLDVAQPTGGGGGVAYFAHIGGFVFGLAAIKLFARRVRKPMPPGPRLPVY